MGGGGSTLRNVRLGALAVFVVLGFALHRSGSAYNTLHAVYFVVIAALIVASIAGRGGAAEVAAATVRRATGDMGEAVSGRGRPRSRFLRTILILKQARSSHCDGGYSDR